MCCKSASGAGFGLLGRGLKVGQQRGPEPLFELPDRLAGGREGQLLPAVDQDQIGQCSNPVIQQAGLQGMEAAPGQGQVLLCFPEKHLHVPSAPHQLEHRDGLGVQAGGDHKVVLEEAPLPRQAPADENQDPSQAGMGGIDAPVVARGTQPGVMAGRGSHQVPQERLQGQGAPIVEGDLFVAGQLGGQVEAQAVGGLEQPWLEIPVIEHQVQPRQGEADGLQVLGHVSRAWQARWTWVRQWRC